MSFHRARTFIEDISLEGGFVRLLENLCRVFVRKCSTPVLFLLFLCAVPSMRHTHTHARLSLSFLPLGGCLNSSQEKKLIFLPRTHTQTLFQSRSLLLYILPPIWQMCLCLTVYCPFRIGLLLYHPHA